MFEFTHVLMPAIILFSLLLFDMICSVLSKWKTDVWSHVERPFTQLSMIELQDVELPYICGFVA